MEKIFIVGALRTAIGTFNGSLANVSPAMLGATVVKALLTKANMTPDMVDETIVGNILCAGQKQGVGRQVAILSGIPQEKPAYSVNMICGSGMKSVINAVMDIRGGLCDVVIAGGTESMSGTPYLIPSKVRTGVKMGDMVMQDHMILDSLTDAFSGVHMGITAENIAEKYNITREQQDEFAYLSQQKAIKAVDSCLFANEIVPITIKVGKEERIFDTDEHPNRNSTPEKLATLRSAFKENGTVTAGNSSGINDGASFVAIASESAVKKYNLVPLVEIVAVGQGGVDPQYMGLGPVPAIRMALKNANMKLSQMDVIELNEAFASQSLGVIKELVDEHDLSRDELMSRINPRGGAIALGHPVGASGNRILVTLIHEMLDEKHQYGLASLCIGGGMGTAIVVKRI